MPKRRKDKQLSRGPWDSAHIVKHLKRMGYCAGEGGRHPNFKHADRSGKVQVPSNWTGVKVGSQTFTGLRSQTGFSKEELTRVLNGLDP